MKNRLILTVFGGCMALLLLRCNLEVISEVEPEPDGCIETTFTFDYDSCLAPLKVYFTSTTAEAETFYWEFGDGMDSNEENPVHVFPDFGTYAVKLTATADCGSADTTISVSLSFAPVYFEVNFGQGADDRGNGVVAMEDGGYFITGFAGSASNNVLLLVMDECGNEIDFSSTGGSATYEGFRIIQEAGGDFILAGKKADSQEQVQMVRISREGTVEDVAFIGDLYQSVLVSDLRQTANGGYILATTALEEGSSAGRAIAYKLDAGFNVDFEYTYSDMFNASGVAMLESPQGGFVFLCSKWTGFSNRILAIKLNGNGGLATSTLLSLDVNAGDDYINVTSAVLTDDGNILISGAYSTFFMSYYAPYVMKINPDGAKIWENDFSALSGGILPTNNWATDIVKASEGGYVMVGVSSDGVNSEKDVFFLKTDANGSYDWSQVFGGSADESAQQVLQTQDGGYLMVGTTESFSNGEQVYVVKVDKNGGGI